MRNQILAGLCIGSLFIVSCSAPQILIAPPTQTVTPQRTETLTPVPTPIAVVPVPTSTPQGVAGSAENPLRIRIIQSDLNSDASLKRLIEEASQRVNVRVNVDVHTADGVYALAQDAELSQSVDAWIGSEYDVAQLRLNNSIATDVVTLDDAMYGYARQVIAQHPQLAIHPLAARNYLIGMGNTDLLQPIPISTEEILRIERNTRGRTRYDMAFAWAEGRWFDAFVGLIEPAATGATALQPPSEDTLRQVLGTYTSLRTLGPREATSYQESIVDFINWRVPYTLDGDAAIRRYAVYSPTLTLSYALPPVYTAVGLPLNPPVDVVSFIRAANERPGARDAFNTMLNALRDRPAQQQMLTALRWIPLSAQTFVGIDSAIYPEVTILAAIAPQLSAQAYNPALICRWDAYESILPFVLLREMRVEEGVSAIRRTIEACYTP